MIPLLSGEILELWDPLQGVGCGIDILWSPGHCLTGQPQSWDWRMSGYGFPFLLKMLNFCRNLVQFSLGFET